MEFGSINFSILVCQWCVSEVYLNEHNSTSDPFALLSTMFDVV